MKINGSDAVAVPLPPAHQVAWAINWQQLPCQIMQHAAGQVPGPQRLPLKNIHSQGSSKAAV